MKRQEYFLQLITGKGATYVGPFPSIEDARALNTTLNPAKRGFIMAPAGRIPFTQIYPEVVSPEDFKGKVGM